MNKQFIVCVCIINYMKAISTFHNFAYIMIRFQPFFLSRSGGYEEGGSPEDMEFHREISFLESLRMENENQVSVRSLCCARLPLEKDESLSNSHSKART
jgi:hypothetical protein